ncbi:transcriptional regulator CynR [Paraburkholderia acidisoli]|uniref:Transcriptional regulator CynR n=2 Tax=Paraburkholderia acidisoli TaxID=2571748 RepID=A0A7Z2JK51_9BURK|nr:transcriptional regulator CynR [Paraburkholderia acidisoli]
MMLRAIRYVITVAELKNFTRAAEVLHVSQPALSQQIRQLEAELGGELFDRSGRAISLTEFGRVYIEHAREALAHLDAGRRALHDVRDLTRGLLRLAYTPTFAEYLIGPALRRFRAAHPALAIEVSERPLEDIEGGLERDELDLGIGFTDVRSDEIDVRPLFAEQMALLVATRHPLARRREAVSSQQLESMPLALLSADFVVRRFADAYFRAHQLSPQVMLQANSVGTVLKLVKDGTLATLLPSAVLREHRGLVSLAVTPALPQRTVALLSRRRAATTLAANAFVALLTDLIAEEGLGATA